MEDLSGTSKHVPDEREVRVHDRLIVPPGLDLRPPTAPSPENVNSKIVEKKDDVLPPKEVSAGNPSSKPVRSAEEIFASYGISRTHSDGTRKSNEEMLEELRSARRKELSSSGSEGKDVKDGGGGFSLEKFFENFSLGGLLGI